MNPLSSAPARRAPVASMRITAGGAGLKPEEVAALVLVLDALDAPAPAPSAVTEPATWRLPVDRGPGAAGIPAPKIRRSGPEGART